VSPVPEIVLTGRHPSRKQLVAGIAVLDLLVNNRIIATDLHRTRVNSSKSHTVFTAALMLSG